MWRLGGGYGFIKSDLAKVYNQIMLAPDIQGDFLLVSEVMVQLTSDLQVVFVYMADILVSGSTALEHIKNPHALFKRLKEKVL